jgi:hypothetical protein
MGDCNDDDIDKRTIKTRLEELLIQVHVDALEEEDDASDLPDTRLVYELIKGIKMLKITWSVNGKTVYGRNEPYFDIAIVRHHQDDDVYFFLSQYITLEKY